MTKRAIGQGILVLFVASGLVFCQDMDEMWGEQVMRLKAADAQRGQPFEEGNHAMFIHWGLYSNIGNLHKGKTYYALASG